MSHEVTAAMFTEQSFGCFHAEFGNVGTAEGLRPELCSAQPCPSCPSPGCGNRQGRSWRGEIWVDRRLCRAAITPLPRAGDDLKQAWGWVGLRGILGAAAWRKPARNSTLEVGDEKLQEPPKQPWSKQGAREANPRIPQWFGLERTFLVQPLPRAVCKMDLPLHQVAPSLIQNIWETSRTPLV